MAVRDELKAEAFEAQVIKLPHVMSKRISKAENERHFLRRYGDVKLIIPLFMDFSHVMSDFV
jgi:hypothetical protein